MKAALLRLLAYPSFQIERSIWGYPNEMVLVND